MCHLLNHGARHLGLAMALATLVVSAQPAAAARRPLPAFALSSVKYSHVVFQGEPMSKISFCERTTNVGNAGTPRGLENRMYLISPAGHDVDPQIVASRDVPKLAGPSLRHGHVVRRSNYGCGHGDSKRLNLPLGLYEVQICADLRIKHRSNAHDCYIRPKTVAVVKRSWTGTASGFDSDVFPDGGSAKVSWQAPSVTYTFSSYDASSRQVLYTLAGSVNYQLAGMNLATCTASGGVTLAASGGELKLDYDNANYTIFAEVPIGSTAPVVYTCPGASSTVPTPVGTKDFITTGFDVGSSSPLPFGYTSISGVFQLSNAGTLTFESQWSLH